MKNLVKNVSLFLFVSVIVFEALTVAQVQEPLERQQARIEKARKEEAAKSVIEREINSSSAIKMLDERLSAASSDTKFNKIITELVSTENRSVIPYLKARLVLYDRRNFDIEVALVQLGDAEYFEKAVLDLKSKDVVVPYYAVWKLSLFKTKESYRKLFELLDDETPRVEKQAIDAPVLTLSGLVKDRLASTVDSPPEGAKAYDTKAWKEWFAKNRHLIE